MIYYYTFKRSSDSQKTKKPNKTKDLSMLTLDEARKRCDYFNEHRSKEQMKKDFPNEASNDTLKCSVIIKSSRFQFFTLMILNCYLKKKNYPGWEGTDKSPNYCWI